ncbi:hypothetical protein [Shewanella holmiensis]|uniref:HEAT repeat domain-containing protein n=1 Tax=Shewanella holmiensis TaxID=2952222 RepID=A0A9X3AQ90_9GAMM|nr:hypothetical protein [Shewanella holmiensis]MCT7942917.1 hypothetical protein [Shewanella holmiensis]
MNIYEALEFLKKHQPLPTDEQISANEIDTFNKVMNYFIDNPDERCIPLMMNAFGDEDGFGVYQLCDDVFNKYEPSKVMPHIKLALTSEYYGVRYWASQWAMDINDIGLFPELKLMLQNPIDEEAHYYCVAALMDIWNKIPETEVSDTIIHFGSLSTNPDILELIEEHKNVLAGL